MKDVGEVICITRIKGNKISCHEQTAEVYFKEYILGFEVEHLWAKTSFFDLIKNLTEEEWDLAAMDPEDVSKFKPEVIIDFDPVEDPRPTWWIQGNHQYVQNQKTNAQPILSEDSEPIQESISHLGQSASCPPGDITARLKSEDSELPQESISDEVVSCPPGNITARLKSEDSELPQESISDEVVSCPPGDITARLKSEDSELPQESISSGRGCILSPWRYNYQNARLKSEDSELPQESISDRGCILSPWR